LPAYDPIIGAHDADNWCKEDGKGVEHSDESCCSVNELPWLDNLLRSVVPHRVWRKVSNKHTQAATKEMIAPLRILMYLGKRPAKSIPPATAFPQIFSNIDVKSNPRARKKTAALAS
jgi:hypothetical protein